jgi:hypothetical protein
MTTKRDCACFVSGLSAGMALMFFFTPRSGAQFRNQIREKVSRGAQALRDGKSAAKGALGREVEGMEAALEAGKRAYQTTTGRGQGA